MKLNAIILEGEMYVLAPTLGDKRDCLTCDLSSQCGRDNGCYACAVFGIEKGFRFHHAERIVISEQVVDRRQRKTIIYKYQTRERKQSKRCQVLPNKT